MLSERTTGSGRSARQQLTNISKRVLNGPPWSRINSYFLIVVVLATSLYRISTLTPVAVAQSNLDPPPIISLATLATPKYFATLEQRLAIREFERQAVADVIEQHKLDPGDSNAVMSWGRSEATVELWALIVRAIETPVAERTADQQHVVTWLTNVQQRQNRLSAVAGAMEYVKWKGLSQGAFQALVDNPNTTQQQVQTFLSQSLNQATGGNCNYRSPSPYQSEYVGHQVASCYTPCQAHDGCIPYPPSYDELVKWGAAVANPEYHTPEFVRVSREAAHGIALGASIVGAATLGVAIGTNTAVAAALAGSSFQLAVLPFAGKAFAITSMATSAAAAQAAGAPAIAANTAAVSQGVAAGGSVAAASVAALIAVAIVMIVIAVIIIIKVVEVLELPGKLASGIFSAQNDVPDLPTMLSNPKQMGGLFGIFVGSTMPLPQDGMTCDNAITGFGTRPCMNAPAIPAPGPTDPQFHVEYESGSSEIVNEIAYWNPELEATFSTRMHGNWFINTVSAADLGSTDPNADPTTVQALRFRYIDWDDKGHTAWLVDDPDKGYMFLATTDIEDGEASLNPSTCVVDGTCKYFPTLKLNTKEGVKYQATVIKPLSPTIAPSFTPLAPTAGVPTTLNANGATQLNVTLTYAWQFLSPTPGYVICVIGQPCDQFSAPVYGESITHTFGSGGVWQVRLTATDSEGRVTSKIFSVTVGSGGAPVLTPSSTDVLTASANEVISIGGIVTHAGADDLVQIWIDWGDGTEVFGAERSSTWQTINICGCLGLERVSGESNQYEYWGRHIYTQMGTYSVKIQVQDPGGVVTETIQIFIQSQPSIEWPVDTPITYGTALSVAQLNASAQDDEGLDVPGTFEYSVNGDTVATGDILPVGQHTISASFVPGDQVHFQAPLPSTATIQVNPRPLTIVAPNLTMNFGATTLPNLQSVTYDGWAPEDGPDTLSGTLACSLTNGTGASVTLSASTPPGTYTVSCTGLTSENYEINWTHGSLAVTSTMAYLAQLTTEKVTNRTIARLAANLLMTAARLADRGNTTLARVAILTYQITITLAQRLGQISRTDTAMLINMSRTL